MSKCPCGSGKTYEGCCGPFIEGRSAAPTAEALMRSRYTAYTRKNIDYIDKTHDPESRHGFDRELAEKWAESVDWQSLEVKSVEAGTEKDKEGVVEFVARFKAEGKDYTHHEVSVFSRRQGTWYYTDGKEVKAPFVRNAPKTGRNDPCPCGSGKKFKKCCEGEAP